MVTVNFYDSVEDHLLKFAVIVARYQNQWVYCKHKERDTYEVPGGTREPDEHIEETARRELYEETGAKAYQITPICVYSVKEGSVETFGMLYFGEITEFGTLPAEYEMERVRFFDQLPDRLTYPHIQPKLVEKVREVLEAG